MSHPVVASVTPDDDKRDHDIQNRLQAILLGINLLERADDSDVREIAGEVREEEEVEHLQRLLATHRQATPVLE